jgi:hypothetical protein
MLMRFFKYLKYQFFLKKKVYIKENSISYIDFEYETSDIRVR